jgi:RNA polymerase sigma factor for flagellar operon FliA
VPFDRYAAARIQGAVVDELRGFDWATRALRTKAHNLARLTETLTSTLGRIPSEAQLAEAAGLSIQTLGRLRADVHRSVIVGYEATLDTGDAEYLLPPATTNNPEEELLRAERVGFLGIALQALPERLETVIRGCFLAERSVSELAGELGVSTSRVSQLRTEALELLRDGVNAQLDASEVIPRPITSGRQSRRRDAYRAAVAELTDHQRRTRTG